MGKVDKAPVICSKVTFFTDEIQLFFYIVTKYDCELKEFTSNYYNITIKEYDMNWFDQDGNSYEMEHVKIKMIQDGIELNQRP